MTATSVPTGNTYDKYESKNPIERTLLARFMANLDRFLRESNARTVLEVGMGEGIVTSRVRDVLAPERLIGIDLPDPHLASGWSDRSLVGMFADITDLPFRDDEFDLVLAIEVLEHVPDPEGALRELSRVANNAVVLSVPREPVWRAANLLRGKYIKDLGNTPGHIQHWSQKSFAKTAAAHLDVTEVVAPFPWTMVAARVRD